MSESTRNAILEECEVSERIRLNLYYEKTYRTRAIITRGLYFFTSFFTAVYIQERFILQSGWYYKETFLSLDFFKIHLMLQKNRIRNHLSCKALIPTSYYSLYLCSTYLPSNSTFLLLEYFFSNNQNQLHRTIFQFLIALQTAVYTAERFVIQ